MQMDRSFKESIHKDHHNHNHTDRSINNSKGKVLLDEEEYEDEDDNFENYRRGSMYSNGRLSIKSKL